MKSRMREFIYSERFIKPLLVLWAVSLLFVLYWLQGIGLSTGSKQQLPVAAQAAQPSGHGSYSYIVSMETDRLSQTDTFLSPAMLLEDDRPIGPGNGVSGSATIGHCRP